MTILAHKAILSDADNRPPIPFPKSTEFSTNDYAVLVAHPASFWKFSEPFLCLIGMSRNYTLDEDTYLTFLHDDGTEMDLLAFIQVADPTKASVERLFDEGGSVDQRDFAAGGGQDTSTGLVTRVKIIVAENVTAKKPKRPRKKRQPVTDASGSSHPPKKLRGGVTKLLVRLLPAYLPHQSMRVCAPLEKRYGRVLHELVSKVRNEPCLRSRATSSCLLLAKLLALDNRHPADSITGLNLRTIGASERSAIVPPVMTEAMVTSHAVTVLLVPETGTKAKDEEIENLKAQLLLKETEAAKAAHLRAQVSAAEARKKIHTNEIDALNQRISSLRSQKDGLVDQVHALKTTSFSLCDKVLGYERLKEQIEEFQDIQMNVVNDKVAKLDADLLEIAFHLEEKFYPHFLTTISGRRWLSTHNLKLAIVKCLNSQEYLSALGATISRIEKGMQNGLSTDIDHGKACRSLADVVAYNPVAKADYKSALQRLREVDFSLLAELKSQKDASVEDIMNLLRLESPLADAPGMNDLQPNVDQLMLHVHQTEDQVVLGETSLSFALSVTHSKVERIRENVEAKRSALIGVWTPLVDLLFVENLVGESGTSDSVPTIIATTTALSTTFASASSIPSITIEDYKIVGTGGSKDALGSGQGNVASFPTIEFEKEELDITSERDLPS
nr:hypothetical protein [Tanacetum cinerariifolium]